MDEEITPEPADKGWFLNIKRIENGYLLTGSNDYGAETQWAVTGDHDEQTELDSDKIEGYNLLWEVMEYFCFGGSKHDSERVRIVIEKRDEEK